jgi:microcin C transport system substrate-binding protein
MLFLFKPFVWAAALLVTGGIQASSKVTNLARFQAKPLFSVEKPYPFVNTQAPKGGALKLADIGTFDTVNYFIVKGTRPQGLLMCYEGMMMRSPTEPFGLYALLAEYVTVAPDSSSITFYINPKATFHDGSPVTAQDALYTFETLRDKGAPRYKHYFSKVASMEVIDSRTLKVTFKKTDNGTFDAELPRVIALVPILCQKQLETIDFANSGLIPIMGTGPYKIGQVEQGRYVALERHVDYWGKHLPLMQGKNNFDLIRIDYYKNEQAQRQAFLAGEFDVMFETNPNQFSTAYKDIPAIEEGRLVKVEAKHERPVAVRFFAVNMRREKFASWHLRKALSLAFDFETLNRLVFAGSMRCPHSLFANTFLAHAGVPTGLEKEMLEGFKSQMAPEVYEAVMAGPFEPARTKGNGDQRENLEKAHAYLKKGGYSVQNGRLLSPKGEPVELEVMIKDPRLEKIALAYRESLKKLGITLNVRMMDTVQYENRVLESDFDIIIHAWTNTLSPGNEQLFYFSADQASKKGSTNYIGIKDPVAEGLARRVAHAQTFEENKAAVAALDRYVMHMCYQVPLTYDPITRWIYWKHKVALPPLDPNVGLNIINYGYAPQAGK